ncbi:MAG TPA: hypothetical protein DCW68_06520 [Rhodospirillaceae bacterium]|nr:MAG: hypothetical protein A2018_01030 [Alphaproteobacteria bacterium GWF2_58_20]HAU29741.1 hypothetical protein [Rhodospirillaceae bacterium]
MGMSYAARYLAGEYASLAYLAGIEVLVLFLARFIREKERVIGNMALLVIVARYASYFIVLALAGAFLGASVQGMGEGVISPVFAKVAGLAAGMGLSHTLRDFTLVPGMDVVSVNAVVMGWARLYFVFYMLIGMVLEWPLVVLAMPKGQRLETWKAMLLARLVSYGFLFFTLTSRDIGMTM